MIIFVRVVTYGQSHERGECSNQQNGGARQQVSHEKPHAAVDGSGADSSMLTPKNGVTSQSSVQSSVADVAAMYSIEMIWVVVWW